MPDDGDTIALNGASNSAPVLIELAEQAGRLFRRSTDDWLACARVLREARKIAGRGQWGRLLSDAEIPARTARRMLAYARADIESGHMAAFSHGEIDTLIASSHRITDLACAMASPSGDRWRLSKSEIEAKRWEHTRVRVNVAMLLVTEHGEARSAVVSTFQAIGDAVPEPA